MATSGIKRRATFLFAPGDGLLPVPGWSSDEWKGALFENSVFGKPATADIATANNAVVGSDYKYLITHEWDKGYRAAHREHDRADKKAGKITLAASKTTGQRQPLAQEVLPLLPT